MNVPPDIWERALEEVEVRYGLDSEHPLHLYYDAAWKIFVQEVEDYVNAGTGHRWAMTTQTRRVVKALRLIGIPRTGFSARTARESDGTYGEALGNVYNSEDAAKVIRYAELLVAAGLRVHVMNEEPGKESAFVATPRYDMTPAVVVHAAVVGRDLLNPAYAVQNIHETRRLT